VITCHPLVLVTILDSYSRRPSGSHRVIGTLLGTTSPRPHTLPDGTVTIKDHIEITNAFQVPHEEGKGGVAIGKDFNRQMLGLCTRVNSKERIVGWFGTTSKVSEFVKL